MIHAISASIRIGARSMKPYNLFGSQAELAIYSF